MYLTADHSFLQMMDGVCVCVCVFMLRLCAQTTWARILARTAQEKHGARFVQLSATTSGVAEVKEAIKMAKNEKSLLRKKTILFIDEIHRFNKLQQVQGADYVSYLNIP